MAYSAYNLSQYMAPVTPTSLSFGGYTPPTTTSYFTPQQAMPAQQPGLVPTGVSTTGTGSMVDSISALTGADPLSQAMVGTGAFNAGTDGTLTNVADPAAQGFSLGGLLKGTIMNEDGGLNLDNITSIIGTAGGIYGAIKQFGLAQDALDFSKETFKTNLANSTKSYNTALEDRAMSRYGATGMKQSDIDSYVKKHKL